jgi:hypothetical protein
VLLAPHPDDEILMAGGLLAASKAEQDVLLISASNGEGSHPHSSQWPSAACVISVRWKAGMPCSCLGLDLNRLDWRRLNLKDGALPHDEAFLVTHLAQLLQPGDLLLTTWRGDGTAIMRRQDAPVPGRPRRAVCNWPKHRSGPGIGPPRRSAPALAPSTPPAARRSAWRAQTLAAACQPVAARW